MLATAALLQRHLCELKRPPNDHQKLIINNTICTCSSLSEYLLQCIHAQHAHIHCCFPQVWNAQNAEDEVLVMVVRCLYSCLLTLTFMQTVTALLNLSVQTESEDFVLSH